MIMTLNANRESPFERDRETLFRRLYAPAFSHTIVKRSRSCESCHNNPLAIGYGRGKLTYVLRDDGGSWIFQPQYENISHDGLPADAWIGFLEERKGDVATRINARPFTVEEQKKILLVGACLTCHRPEERRLGKPFDDFRNVRSLISEKCILPDWK